MGMGLDQKQEKINSIRLTLYEKCVNKIDDYFEYRYKSDDMTGNRDFVIAAIDDMTIKLKEEIHKLWARLRRFTK